jgi:hypothetical protein
MEQKKLQQFSESETRAAWHDLGRDYLEALHERGYDVSLFLS